MDETMKTGIPPSAEMEEVNVSRLDDNEADNTGATAEADAGPVTDTGAGREEDQRSEDAGGCVPADGDEEGPGEVPQDEPEGAPEDAAQETGPEAVIEKAVSKLNGWKARNKDPYAQLICDHLIRRCRQDTGFAEDVLKTEKAWNTCFMAIKERARKKAVQGCACIEDSVVYEWAEDYIREEEQKKAPEKKSQKTGTKPKENAHPATENAHPATENAQIDNENAQAAPEAEQQETKKKTVKAKKKNPKTEEKKTKTEKEKPEKPKKEKKDKNEMDGQIDLFSLFE